jgi:hypothetical protein
MAEHAREYAFPEEALDVRQRALKSALDEYVRSPTTLKEAEVRSRMEDYRDWWIKVMARRHGGAV